MASLHVGSKITLTSETDVLDARVLKLERLESGLLQIIAVGDDGKQYTVHFDDSGSEGVSTDDL